MYLEGKIFNFHRRNTAAIFGGFEIAA